MLTIHPDDEVFSVFSNYGYEKRLLIQIDSDILFKHCGFSNCANAFNYVNSKFEKNGRNHRPFSSSKNIVSLASWQFL